MTRLHRIEALSGAGRYAVTFQRADTSEQTAVVHVNGAELDVAEASLPEGWSRDGEAFAAVAAAVFAVERARELGPATAHLSDVDGGWDVMMGNVVVGDAGEPTCTAHGPMARSGGSGIFECAECGARAAYTP